MSSHPYLLCSYHEDTEKEPCDSCPHVLLGGIHAAKQTKIRQNRRVHHEEKARDDLTRQMALGPSLKEGVGVC